MNIELKDIPLPDSREIYDLVTQHNNKYDETFISEKARSDAAHNIPAPEESQASPFEQQLVHETSKLCSKVVVHYRRALEMLDARIKGEEDVSQKRQTYGDKNIQELSSHFVQDVDDSLATRTATSNLKTAEERYNKFYDKYGRAPVVYIPHLLYILFALGIFAGEIPLNALVFQIFGENQVMTWVMAVIIGMSVPLSAHFIGIKFREHSDKVSWGNVVKGLVALAVMVVALYGLSVMRQTYLGEFKDALGLTDRLVESSFMFFWLNIAVLGAAIMIAYMSHDSVPGYQKAEAELKAARKSLMKLESWRRKQRLSSRYEKRDLMKSGEQQSIDDSRSISTLKGYYDMVLKEGQELERQCLQGLRHDIELYRRENLQSRPDKTRPKSFDLKHEIDLKLSEMKEKLQN